MPNSWFQFKQFTVQQDRCAMKVTTDACLFGAWAAKQLRKTPDIHHILDIGTGTALLSLMLAQQSTARIDAIEIDNTTCEQATSNINQSPWKERIAIIHGNAKDLVQTSGNQYDIIISNPPFYENELQSGKMQKNVAHHGTELKLDDLIQIINSTVLKQQGAIYLLLPYKRRQEVETAFETSNLSITHTMLVRQSTNHSYFRIMIEAKKGTSTAPGITEELAIRDEHDQYTPAFTGLLKDYYLQL